MCYDSLQDIILILSGKGAGNTNVSKERER